MKWKLLFKVSKSSTLDLAWVLEAACCFVERPPCIGRCESACFSVTHFVPDYLQSQVAEVQRKLTCHCYPSVSPISSAAGAELPPWHCHATTLGDLALAAGSSCKQLQQRPEHRQEPTARPPLWSLPCWQNPDTPDCSATARIRAAFRERTLSALLAGKLEQRQKVRKLSLLIGMFD